MPASRSVVSVLLRELGDFSLLSSRPALRAAACGGCPWPEVTFLIAQPIGMSALELAGPPRRSWLHSMVETGLTPSILAGVFAILGVGIGATLQRNLERRRWLRDARYLLYSEFSEIARHAAEANMELKKEVAALPPNTLLGDDRAQALVSNLQDHQKQLERLYYRIRMVGSINMQHMADRITASAEEVAYPYIIGRLPITQESFHEHLLLRHETVDDFIHAARNDLRSVDRVDEARESMYLRVKRLHYKFRLRRMRRHTTYSNEDGT